MFLLISACFAVVFGYSLYLWLSHKSVPKRPWGWVSGWILAIIGGILILFTIQNYYGSQAELEQQSARTFLDVTGLPGLVMAALGWIFIVIIGSKEVNPVKSVIPASSSSKNIEAQSVIQPSPGQFCYQCGKKLGESALFCPQCGAKRAQVQVPNPPAIEDEKRCPHCGEKLIEEVVFCPKCGTKQI